MWTYTIGAFCGVLATMSPDTVRFKQTFDALNRMMAARAMPKDTRESASAGTVLPLFKVTLFFFRVSKDLRGGRKNSGCGPGSTFGLG